MSHRSFELDYGTVHAFDTGLAAHRFIAKNEGPLKILARGRFFFIRVEDGTELTVLLRAAPNDKNGVYLKAAHDIERHVEARIAAEEDNRVSEVP